MTFLPDLQLAFHTPIDTATANSVFSEWLEKLDAAACESLAAKLAGQPQLAGQLVTALMASDYVYESTLRSPELLFHYLLSHSPYAALTPVMIVDVVTTACADPLTLDEFNELLRHWRCRFMCSLYWRMANGLADFDEVTRAVTAMAEVFVQQAVNFHYADLCNKHGTPMGKDSHDPQPLLVIGMGKLGGGELNVSSDIDLIFVFPEAGATNHSTRPLDNQQFFNRLGQQLIKTLNEVTAEGFVFRVDMRLRPYGESGSLTSNFVALENYYQTQGRDWERFATIKARVIACATLPDTVQSQQLEQQFTEQFYQIIQPFVYRRYIDFSTVESLRRLKAMIVQEVRRKGIQDDIKLGAGGIREIEFIVQSFQLIRGGIDPRLQQRNLLSTLQALLECGDLADDVVHDLREAYLFLRTTEHAIQAQRDAQTQRLPVDKPDRQRLAWVMGFATWEAFLQVLNQHRQFVSAHFQQVIADAESRPGFNDIDDEWQQLWHMPAEQAEWLSEQSLFDESHDALMHLRQFQQSRNVLSLSATAREKLDQFMPHLLHVISTVDAPELAWRRSLDWLEAIVTRTSYVLLLLENPQVLKQLVSLLAASAWVTETLTQMPSLLDELLHPEQLYALPDKATLRDELRQRLLRLDPDDLEAHMEALRYFRLAHNLHVAASEVSGHLPLMKVSDYLTLTAEILLEQVLKLAWRELHERHGSPPGTSDEQSQFLVVGYGKLGGLEMSYSSDLDLVFIYDAEPQAMTDGPKPIDVQTFYTRLGQKMIHIMGVRTLSGQLYETDMRLRPSGNSGLLVTSLNAYRRYQLNDAWIWEHQALVRARPVAGDHGLADQFLAVRHEVLSQSRDLPLLQKEVVAMREKMRQHLGSSGKTAGNSRESLEFHLKQDTGGIVDIEFMVQYAVLAWAYRHPTLTEWTDNIRLLERLQGLAIINAEQATQLIEIYQSYRRYSHRLALQQTASAVIDAEQFANERKQVIELWDYFFNTQDS